MPAVVAAVTAFASTEAEAGALAPYRVLHSFCRTQSCGDGTFPMQQPVLDADGNLYGVAFVGGRYDGGTLYELSPVHEGKRYFKHALKAFCDPRAQCGTGYGPLAGPIMDTKGNLYGTTSDTGLTGATTLTNCGSVYMAVVATVTAGAKAHPPLTALHQFGKADGCTPNYGSLDYQGKEQGQLYDGVSPLYGMTSGGGAHNEGVIYEIRPPQPGRVAWSEQVLYDFCSISDCADGQAPQGNLVMDANGNLFGGTSDGLIFKLSPNGSGGFSYSAIHVSSTTSENYVAFALASDGRTLIGVADSGGTTTHGTLFSLAPSCGACGARIAPPYQYTLLHDFCSGGGTCADGDGPNSVVIDAGGNIFGTTYAGGSNDGPPNSGNTGGGTIFEYTSGGSFFPIHDFCAQTNCADGGAPQGGLMTDGNGNFYGTTTEGGATINWPTGAGTVYELSLPPA